MDYTEVNFAVSPKEPATEILIAELGEAGFEMFVETETGVLAYIPHEHFSDSLLSELKILNSEIATISFGIQKIKDQNWNKEWEKNFEPIIVNNDCIVRAPFHQFEKSYKYDLIIEPKMSFGTGHHETTFLVLSYMLDMDFVEKKVLDMGCGTAVLAILASKKGAQSIDAIDIDSWSVENSVENADRNNTPNIEVVLGDASLIEDKPEMYDVVLANINRNILLRDITTYEKSMKHGAYLLLSGFFVSDIPLLLEKAVELKLKLVGQNEKNNWATLCLSK